jgi:hypothetical protein
VASDECVGSIAVIESAAMPYTVATLGGELECGMIAMDSERLESVQKIRVSWLSAPGTGTGGLEKSESAQGLEFARFPNSRGGTRTRDPGIMRSGSQDIDPPTTELTSDSRSERDSERYR